MKIILLFLLSCTAFAQVGIGTTSPEATLDIKAKNHTATPGVVDPNDGVLVPRVSSLSVSGITNGQLVYLVANNGGFTRGFHYWNGIAWISVGADGDAWAVNGEDVTSNIGRNGSLAVGSLAANAYSKLDVSSSNQGILIPRVNLTSYTLDLNSDGDGLVSNQPVGLIIYNSGSTFPAGLYFWNGIEWRGFNNSTTGPGAIGSILCTDITLTPNTYVNGSPYSGTMTVPYTGGNGGAYSAQSIGPINGLTATLLAGNFNNGSGSLTYTVSGIPTVTSPSATNFSINIGGQTCTASVGSGSLAIGQSISATYSVPNATATPLAFLLSTYVTANGLTPLPVIDGLQIDLAGYDGTFYRPRIYNVSPSNQLVSYQTFATQVNENKTSLNLTLTTSGTSQYAEVDNNNIVYWTTTLAEVITTNIQVQINATTYRWYEFKWWCMEVSGQKKIFLTVRRVA